VQDACGIANATGVHGHLDDLLFHRRKLAGIGIVQEKRTPLSLSTRPASVALLPSGDFPRLTLSVPWQ
jgi:hypothetical protein